MKVLLTGGTGYIGSHTAVELINESYEVEIIDNLRNSKTTVLDKIEKITGAKPAFYQIDLLGYNKVDQLFKNHHYDAVIHFAGLKSVNESIEKPLEYYENNLCGTINLLKAMKKHSVKKLIFSSSATVYGNKNNIKLKEDAKTGISITNPYGKTKYMIEEIIKDLYATDKSLEVTMLRYFNPIGAHPSGLIGEDPNTTPNNLMPIITKVATGEIPTLSIYGNDYDTPDGTAMRDFIHVVDLAKGHVLALKKIHPGIAIYNLGTGKAASVLEIVHTFERVSGKPLPHKFVARRPGDLPKFYANPQKAKQELGWKTHLTIEDAIKDTINYLNNT